MDVVYLDFSKAFNTISHNILRGNLRKRGINERVDSEMSSCVPQFSPGEATPGVLCPVLGSLVHEGHRATGQSSVEGYEDG